MGNFQNKPVDEKVNKHNFETHEIHSKAGVEKKTMKGIFSYLLLFPAIIYSYVTSFFTGINPFKLITILLYHKYCKNISDDQKIALTRLINDEFDMIFNSINNGLEIFIKTVIEKYDIEKLTAKEFKKLKSDIKKIDNNSKKINILLIGKTGVGKSTLINSLLKEDVAKESLGSIGTLSFDNYSSPAWKNINLIDSQGFDLSKPFDNFAHDSINFIEKSNESKMKFIDLIYYCYTGLRFEKNEKELVQELIALYEQIKVPVIFVNTQSITDDFERMKEFIKNDFDNKDLIITEVLAKSKTLKNGVTIPSFGIEELKSITEKQFENIKETAYYKKFYRNCLNKLYESNIIYRAANVKLNDFIEQLLISNTKKYSFSKYDVEDDESVKIMIKSISNDFLIAFKLGLKKIAELMIDLKIESEIAYEKEIKQIDLKKDEKTAEEFKKKIKIEEFQNEIQELILIQYYKCFNEIIENKFEEKLQKIYKKQIYSFFTFGIFNH